MIVSPFCAGESLPVPGGILPPYGCRNPGGHSLGKVTPLGFCHPPRGAWEQELMGNARCELTVSYVPPPPFPLTLKSRAICARSLPALLVAYGRTAPPSFRSGMHTSDPIHRVPVRWSVRAQQSCTLPPRPGAAELYTSNLSFQSRLLRRPGRRETKRGQATSAVPVPALRSFSLIFLPSFI